MMKKIVSILSLALIIGLFPSCVEENTPTPEVAPEIPPTEILAIPTTVLEDTHTDTSGTALPGSTYRNWIYSAVNVVVWHTVVVLHSAIPTAAFGLALNETPQYIGNGVFEWSYQYQADASLGGKTYDVVLTAEYINGAQDVQWIMTLSEQGGFQNFEWYRGIVSTDHTEANITVNRRPNNPEAYLSIEYNGTPGLEGTLRYTNISQSDNASGGYIEYQVDNDGTFNRGMDIQGGQNNPNVFIQIDWNEPTFEGRVKSPTHYNDNDWHCWDSNQADTDC